MEGMTLILSMVCVNSTYCPGESLPSPVNYIDHNHINLNFYEKEIDELAKSVKGKTLVVSTLEDFPLSYTERVDGKLVGKGQGFDLLDMLVKKFDFNYTVVRPTNNVIGGSNTSDGSLIELLLQNRSDMSVSFIPMVADIIQYVDFSTTLDEGEWKMIMRRPKESASGAGLLAPFTHTVWYFILVSLIVTGPAVWMVIWLYHKFGKFTGEPYYNLFQCCWFVYGGLMKQGSVLSPNSNSIRVAFGTWWIYITIVTSFYTANLTAFLTLAKFSLPINEPQDLLAKRHQFICQKGFGLDYTITNLDEELTYLKPMIEKKLVKFVTQNNDTNVLLTDVWEDNYIFIRDWPALGHLVYEDWIKRKTLKAERFQCPFATSKKTSLRRRRGFIYPKGSPLKKLFDPTLQSLFEAGIIRYRMNDGLPRAEICPQNLGSTERQLRLHDLGTTYATMLAGFIVGLVVFLAELFTRYMNKRKAREANETGGFGIQPTVRRIDVKPTQHYKKNAINTQAKMISPPPAYGEAIKTIFNTPDSRLSKDVDGKIEGYRTFNGRTYAIVRDEGGTQLVPTRAPSAALFNYQMQYNN